MVFGFCLLIRKGILSIEVLSVKFLCRFQIFKTCSSNRKARITSSKKFTFFRHPPVRISLRFSPRTQPANKMLASGYLSRFSSITGTRNRERNRTAPPSLILKHASSRALFRVMRAQGLPYAHSGARAKAPVTMLQEPSNG